MGPAPSAGRKAKSKQRGKKSGQGKRIDQIKPLTADVPTEVDGSKQVIGSASSEEAVPEPAQALRPLSDEQWTPVNPSPAIIMAEPEDEADDPDLGSSSEVATQRDSSLNKADASATSSAVPSVAASQHRPIPLRRAGPSQQVLEPASFTDSAGRQLDSLFTGQSSGHIQTGRPSSASSRRLSVPPEALPTVSPSSEHKAQGQPPLSVKPASRLRRAEFTTATRTDPGAALAAVSPVAKSDTTKAATEAELTDPGGAHSIPCAKQLLQNP